MLDVVREGDERIEVSSNVATEEGSLFVYADIIYLHGKIDV